mmetsp:Transcript_25216/g.77729  ORF Transcript_25216/g.77729 Transcript_25216/m.77729 type:complete len:234 (+) Transcript_25216:134-835(+)
MRSYDTAEKHWSKRRPPRGALATLSAAEPEPRTTSTWCAPCLNTVPSADLGRAPSPKLGLPSETRQRSPAPKRWCFGSSGGARLPAFGSSRRTTGRPKSVFGSRVGTKPNTARPARSSRLSPQVSRRARAISSSSLRSSVSSSVSRAAYRVSASRVSSNFAPRPLDLFCGFPFAWQRVLLRRVSCCVCGMNAAAVSTKRSQSVRRMIDHGRMCSTAKMRALRRSIRTGHPVSD